MSLVNTGVGKITGLVSSVNNSIMLFDETTGELAKQSSATISDAGDITANKFIGDGSQLTSLPGGAGTGDVAGPTSSIDFRVPTFNAETGRLLRQSPVSIFDNGIMLGVTSFTVDNILIDGNTIEAIGSNQSIDLKGSGTGSVLLNNFLKIDSLGKVTGATQLTVDDIFIFDNVIASLNSKDILLDPSLAGVVDVKAALTQRNSNQSYGIQSTTSSTSAVGLRTKQHIANTSTIIDFYKDTNVRKGWVGFGSSSDRNQMFVFNDLGGITITPQNANGVITMTGFTKLGDTINHPEIKIKMLKGTTSSGSTGSISISHGLLGASIVSITGIIHHATNSGITPGYEAGGGSFDWDVWHDATKVNIINNGSNITSKQVSILVTYLS